MIKQYFKQAWNLLKQNRLLSIISIIGTALAICMIMCIVLIYQVKTANYEPEVNRDRTLSVEMAIAQGINDDQWNSGGQVSLKVVKECFYSLTSPEAVSSTRYFPPYLAGSPDGIKETKCRIMGTDDTFWKVFAFHFLQGKPYNKEVFESGLKQAVITKSLARKIFGTEDVVGQTILLSYDPFTISGVVSDVSVLAEKTYADVWIPYSIYKEVAHDEGLLGRHQVHILAHSKADFDVIRKEVNRKVIALNAMQKSQKLLLMGRPYDQLETLAAGQNVFSEPNVTTYVGVFVIIVAILLLVPAINLSGITLSRMNKRMEEMGVRRAFGANRKELLKQVLMENFLLTLLGGVLGILLSYLAVMGLREWLLSSSFSGGEITIHTGMIVSPAVFLWALLFCLMMNLLSAGIPAWRVSKVNIVNALNKVS